MQLLEIMLRDSTCKRLQNESALNYVQFFSGPLCILSLLLILILLSCICVLLYFWSVTCIGFRLICSCLLQNCACRCIQVVSGLEVHKKMVVDV